MRPNRTVALAIAALLAIALVPTTGVPAVTLPTAGAGKPGLSQFLALATSPVERVVGIATFEDSPPAASEARALRKLGLTVQPMKRLPLAIVHGTVAQIRSAVTKGIATDVYPNEKLDWHSRESRNSVRADRVPLDITGKGIGVAVVDSGIDASHPDLAKRVTHNIKMVGPEYLGITGLYVDPNMPPGTLVIPIEELPYNNSDLSSGHGTHVAGIVGADGTTSPEQTGMAPEANLIGYATGDVALIFVILGAFEHILEHREEWGIRVVNNSWGSSFRTFDPAHPINVATKALADAGIVVAFSAGNSYAEMQVNPWSVAPWVISVGSGTTSAQRSSFSSGGLEYDNSLPVALPEDGHLRFEGDRIGLYHPDVTGPGSDIVSSGTPTGLYVNAGQVPPGPGGTVTASGTSMSSPHIAGLAALLLQARPDLTPSQVREVMQVSSTRMRDDTPFWHAGHGWVDAADAIALVRRKDFGPALLATLQAKRDAAVLAARNFKVISSDFWTFTPALPATVLGLDGMTFEVDVPSSTKAFKAAVSFPAVPLVGNPLGLYDWQLIVTDAAGSEVASSTVSGDAGLSSVFVDLVNPGEDANGNQVPPPQVTYGKWTIDVVGNFWAVDPLEILATRQVNVSFAQLAPQKLDLGNLPVFNKASNLSLYFQPDGSGGPVTSPEGCALQPAAATGGLSPAKATGDCQAGHVGYAVNYGAGVPAEFISEPIKGQLVVGGPSVLRLYLADTAQPAWSVAFASGLTYTLDALAGDEVIGVAGGEVDAVVSPTGDAGEYKLVIPPTVVPAGARLRLQMSFSGVYTSTMRMLYGGDYADSGITMGIGSFQVAGAKGGSSAPSPAPQPAVKATKQLPATGVGSSGVASALLVGAAFLSLASARTRRTHSLR